MTSCEKSMAEKLVIPGIVSDRGGEGGRKITHIYIVRGRVGTVSHSWCHVVMFMFGQSLIFLGMSQY